MLDVSEEVKDLYLTDNTPVEIRLTIGNNVYGSRDLVAGTVSITESICSLETFTLSTVEKNELTFSLFNENQTIKELVGKTVTATHILTLEDESEEYIPLGTYTIVDAVKDGDYIVQCTCYDTMLAFDKIIDDWWNNRVQFPISIRSLVISLFNEVGVQYTLPNTFTNEEFIISVKPTFFENVKASEVLSYIQEVVGGFFKADRFGVVRLLSAKKLGVLGLVPKIGLYPRVGLHPSTSGTIGFGEDAEVQDYAYRHIFGDLTIGDYAVSRISAVQIRGTEDDVGVIVGSGEDAYIIEGNPLLFNITDTTGRAVAEKLFEILREIIYVPFSGEFKALPFLEVGDCAYIITYVGNVVKSPILYRVMSSQKLSVDSFTTKGTKHRQLKHAVNRMLSTVNQKTHEVINTVDELVSTVTQVEQTVETHTTQISQNANEINLVVERTGYQNYIVNGDFSDISDSFKGWTKSVRSGNTVEIVDDPRFPSGKACHFVQVENGNAVAYYEFDFNEEINLYGKKIVVYEQVEHISSSYSTYLHSRILGKKTDGTFEVLFTGDISHVVGTKNIRFAYTPTSEKIVTAIRILPFFEYTNSAGEGKFGQVCVIITNADDEIPERGFYTDLPKNNLVSQINLSPSGVQIRGEKVDIWGVTTIHNTDGTGKTVLTGSTIRSATIETGTLRGSSSALTFDMSTQSTEYKIKMAPASFGIWEGSQAVTRYGVRFDDENNNGAVGIKASIFDVRNNYYNLVHNDNGFSIWKLNGSNYEIALQINTDSTYGSVRTFGNRNLHLYIDDSQIAFGNKLIGRTLLRTDQTGINVIHHASSANWYINGLGHSGTVVWGAFKDINNNTRYIPCLQL